MSLIKGLTKDYEGFKLDIPSLELLDEGVTALWGPSGSGKTTIFRLLIGLEECPALSWMWDSMNLAELPVPERRLGVVFQNYELFPHMTARENLEFAARARKISKDKMEVSVRELARDLQMEGYLDRRAKWLSGGEAQRVALARALIGEPRFLFLDEPFSALDADLKKEARLLTQRMIAKLKIPTLLITHDPQDLESLAQKVVRIHAGRLFRG